jgi:hypothetical protein
LRETGWQPRKKKLLEMVSSRDTLFEGKVKTFELVINCVLVLIASFGLVEWFINRDRYRFSKLWVASIVFALVALASWLILWLAGIHLSSNVFPTVGVGIYMILAAIKDYRQWRASVTSRSNRD